MILGRHHPGGEPIFRFPYNSQVRLANGEVWRNRGVYGWSRFMGFMGSDDRNSGFYRPLTSMSDEQMVSQVFDVLIVVPNRYSVVKGSTYWFVLDALYEYKCIATSTSLEAHRLTEGLAAGGRRGDYYWDDKISYGDFRDA